MLALVASIVWGLAVLSGFGEDTPNVALAGPVALGLLGTLLVTVLTARLLATE